MSNSFGKRAVVIGAGVGGLCAARVLADHFDEVIVLERDALPSEANPRPGTPQCRHLHALLVGGLTALEDMFPGFERDLADAGAVTLRIGLDVVWERPGYDPFPRRDLGLRSYAMSRPLIELTIRRRLLQYPNVILRENCRATSLVASEDKRAVTTVAFEAKDGKGESLPVGIVIDASGRGALALAFLQSTGHSSPEETTIGIDIAYSTAVFAMPNETPLLFKGAVLIPNAPQISRGGFLLSIEHNRWIVSLGGAHGDQPPGDHEGFLDFARSLRTSTIFDAIKHAELIAPIARYAFT